MQKKSNFLKKNRDMTRWILAVVYIELAVGILLTVFALFLIRKVYQSEVTYQQKMTEQSAQVLQGICEEASYGARTLLNNELVEAARYRGDEEVADRMRLSQISSLLINYVSGNSNIEDIYLIFPQLKNTAVLNTSEYINLNDHVHTVSGLDMISEENRELFTGNLYHEFKIAGSQPNRSVYLCASNSAVKELEEQDALILVKLKISELKNRITYMDRLILLDGNGDYLQLTGEELSEAEILRYAEAEEITRMDRRLICPINPEIPGLRVMGVIEQTAVTRTARNLILVLAVYSLLVMGFGAMYIAATMRKRYVRVDDVLKFLDEHKVIDLNDPQEEEDAFRRLEEGVRRACEQIDDTQEEFNSFVKDNEIRLLNILYNGRDVQSFDELSKKEANSWINKYRFLEDSKNNPGNRFTVVSFDINSVSEEPVSQEDRDLIWFIIHNISAELFGEEHLLAAGGLAHWFIDIIRRHDKDELTDEQIHEHLTMICLFLQEKLGFNLVANVSESREGIGQIPAGYREAMLLREYRIYVGELDTVAYYHQINLDDEARKTLTSWNQLEQVHNIYRLHPKTQAKEIFDQLLDEAAGRTDPPQTPPNTEELTARNIEIAEKGRHYVDEHYKDKEMNVNSIADTLGVNNSYLSRIFKQVYGKGMLEYINDVRLSAAEELMQAGTSVKDAADMVGFSTPRPLIRCFKQRHGITPGEYYKKN